MEDEKQNEFQTGKELDHEEHEMEDYAAKHHEDDLERGADNTGTEFTEHSTEGYSDDLLSVTGKGVWGILEKVPLVVKLICMCTISLLGMIVLACFLLVIETKTLRKVAATKRFALDASQVGDLITALQDERDLSNTALYSKESGLANFSDFHESLRATYKASDDGLERVFERKLKRYLSFVNRNFSGDSRIVDRVEAFNTSLALLEGTRESLETATPQSIGSITNVYTILISHLLDVLTLLMQDATTKTTLSYLNLLRIYEYQQTVKVQAQAALMSGRVTFSSFREIGLTLFNRDTMITNWISSSPVDIVERYNRIISDQFDLMRYLTNLETVLVTYRDGIRQLPIPAIYSLSFYNDNTTTYNDELKDLQQYIARKFNKENDDELRFSTALLIVIAVVIAVFFILSIVAGVVMSFTIVGPWRRLNALQKNAISKFVPQQFLKLIGFSNIADVSLGKFEQKDLTMMIVDMRDFVKTTSGMKAESVFNYLNSYLNHVGPVIRKNSGFISRYNASGFVALFKSPKNGLKTSIEIQAMMRGYNSLHEEEFPPVSVGVGLHSAKMLIGTVGEDERLEASVVSHEARISELLESMAIKFRANILTSKASLERSGKFAAKHVQTRDFGNIIVENATGDNVEVEVVEVLNQDTFNKSASKEVFERAVDNFKFGRYSDAVQQFNEASDMAPEDLVATLYKKKAQQLVDQCKFIASNLGISSILRDNSLLQGFEVQAKNEHSTENIMLWKEIEHFKDIVSAEERRVKALQLQKDFFSMDGDYTININERLKDSIAVQLQDDSADVPSALYNEVQKELEILMADTCKRFKESSAFSCYLMGSMYSPPKPHLNDL